MNSPIETFESIRDFYIAYLETAFRIGPPEIQALRRKLLEDKGTLCADLFLEPMPKYEDYGLAMRYPECQEIKANLGGPYKFCPVEHLTDKKP